VALAASRLSRICSFLRSDLASSLTARASSFGELYVGLAGRTVRGSAADLYVGELSWSEFLILRVFDRFFPSCLKRG
jgi:hypothetical protein